jgi:hypothetical protein
LLAVHVDTAAGSHWTITVDLLTLARNSRTSVEMVEKFYSPNLSAEIKFDLQKGLRDRLFSYGRSRGCNGVIKKI